MPFYLGFKSHFRNGQIGPKTKAQERVYPVRISARSCAEKRAANKRSYGHLMRGGRVVLLGGGQIVLLSLATDTVDQGGDALG